MITSTTKIRVRYVETDKMGIVYHSNYFTWFEVARIQMLDELGYPYRELEAKGYLLPVMEAHANYTKPARFDDEVTIQLKIPQKPSVKFRIDYELYTHKTLLMTGHTVHAFMSPDGQAIRPPKDLLELMRKAYG